MDSIFKIRGLKHNYTSADTGVQLSVFDELDLNIERGTFVVLLGHNGSGKSTLAKHLNAILLPSFGKVYVDDIDTADEDKLIEIRRTVGMVFQNPDNQIVSNVVEEDVAFAPENLGVEPEEIRRRVDDALRIVDMEALKNHAPHLLSGGQKQRIAIAGIIAMRPKCIVLDEPTAMLDPYGRKDVLETVHKLNKEYGITVVLITHHMNEAVGADRVIVLDNGHILLDDSPGEVFQNVEMLRDAELTVPETVGLLYQLRRKGINVPLDALTVEECSQAIYAYFTRADKNDVLVKD